MDTIIKMDVDALLWIQNNLRSEELTALMEKITLFGEHGIFWIVICLSLMAFKKTRRIGIICSLSLALTFICCNLLIKPIVDRLRPWEAYPVLKPLLEDPGDASFPSGHTANAMGPAWALFLTGYDNKKARIWGVLAVILAFFIGFSRIYLGVHYPSDVICALILGVLCASTVYYSYRRYEKTRGMDRQRIT